jgi:Family of unknown function (DUF6152)
MSSGAGIAHHSFAMFNMELPTELEGTVQEFRFSNPHSFLLVKVKGQDGRTVTWTLEGTSPASLGRDGWSGQTLRPGDQIRLTIWPLASGGHGGVWYPKWTHFRDGRAIVSNH